MKKFALILALYASFQCGQVYKSYRLDAAYSPGLPDVVSQAREFPPITLASVPMNYYPPEYEGIAP